MQKQVLTCIGCPMGCEITVTMDNGAILSVEGNTCDIGDKYARKEVTHPERTVTSTVVVTGGDKPRLSVKTASAIPKEKIQACMEEINHLSVSAPVRIGDVLIPDTAGTGIAVVATRNIQAAS